MSVTTTTSVSPTTSSLSVSTSTTSSAVASTTLSSVANGSSNSESTPNTATPPNGGSGTKTAEEAAAEAAAIAEEDEKRKKFIIIGASVGGFLLLMTCILIWGCARRRKRHETDSVFGNGFSAGSHLSLGSSSLKSSAVTPISADVTKTGAFVGDNAVQVVKAYNPNLSDEVQLRVGDSVKILEAYDDGMLFGISCETKNLTRTLSRLGFWTKQQH